MTDVYFPSLTSLLASPRLPPLSRAPALHRASTSGSLSRWTSQSSATTRRLSVRRRRRHFGPDSLASRAPRIASCELQGVPAFLHSPSPADRRAWGHFYAQTTALQVPSSSTSQTRTPTSLRSSRATCGGTGTSGTTAAGSGSQPGSRTPIPAGRRCTSKPTWSRSRNIVSRTCLQHQDPPACGNIVVLATLQAHAIVQVHGVLINGHSPTHIHHVHTSMLPPARPPPPW